MGAEADALAAASAEAAKAFAAMDGEPLPADPAPAAVQTLAQPPLPPATVLPTVAAAAADDEATATARSMLPDLLRAAAGAFAPRLPRPLPSQPALSPVAVAPPPAPDHGPWLWGALAAGLVLTFAAILKD